MAGWQAAGASGAGVRRHTRRQRQAPALPAEPRPPAEGELRTTDLARQGEFQTTSRVGRSKLAPAHGQAGAAPPLDTSAAAMDIVIPGPRTLLRLAKLRDQAFVVSAQPPVLAMPPRPPPRAPDIPPAHEAAPFQPWHLGGVALPAASDAPWPGPCPRLVAAGSGRPKRACTRSTAGYAGERGAPFAWARPLFPAAYFLRTGYEHRPMLRPGSAGARAAPKPCTWSPRGSGSRDPPQGPRLRDCTPWSPHCSMIAMRSERLRPCPSSMASARRRRAW